jgi:hypothetical protein
MAASWYVYKFNPFHLPTVESAEKMGGFSELNLWCLYLSSCASAGRCERREHRDNE